MLVDVLYPACDVPVAGGAAEAYLYNEWNNGATVVEKVGEADWGIDWGEPQLPSSFASPTSFSTWIHA
jgi:hypothetical protein